MLQPYQRATLIPNEPGKTWHHFLNSRFLEPPREGESSIAIVMQSIAPQSEEHAEVRGLLELIAGTSLPLVSEFVGVLNLESREISIHDANQGRHFSGQISENGRVIVLRQKSHARPIHLIDEATLQEII